MNGLILTSRNNGAGWGEQLPIVEYIYGIIDSKIDFMELKSRKLLENLNTNKNFGSHQSDSDWAKPSAPNGTIVEPLFTKVENLSRSMYLLEKIKLSLRHENAFSVISLLENDKYLSLNDDQIASELEFRPAA
jgi:hypothetical protein